MDALFSILVFIFILWLIYYVISLMPLPPPMKNIVLIIFGIIVIFLLLGMLTGYGGIHMPSFK